MCNLIPVTDAFCRFLSDFASTGLRINETFQRYQSSHSRELRFDLCGPHEENINGEKFHSKTGALRWLLLMYVLKSSFRPAWSGRGVYYTLC